MELIRRGDRGERVIDVQARLVALGYPIPPDERTGIFGPATEDAIRSFQQTRGVVVDGLVGDATWRELVEACFTLGDRVLYLRAPHMRGDDVRELQDRLQTLGFDTGRTDGIFGPRTAHAAREFQRNYGLPADGIVADHTLRAMNGLPRLAGDTPVGILLEKEAMRRRAGGIASMRIALDPGHGGDDPGVVGPAGSRESEVCLALASRVEPALAAAGAEVFVTRRADANPDDSERAALANTLNVDVLLALHLGGDVPAARGAAAFFFGHPRFRSESGARLAELLVEGVVALGITDARTHAKTYPILRETRMTAVQFEPGHLTNPEEERLLNDNAFLDDLARSIVASLERFTRVGVTQ